ncbi:MAG: sugar transporter, partial [Winogradskyella sp.]|nr:sugar transporter [Winogradskyella sp.]
MDYNDDIEFNESNRISFDFKGMFFKIFSYWPLIVLFVLLCLSVAYYINIRKQNIYRLESLISVENDQNPFFTSTTSISFNWGGVSNKVGSIITEVKTRTHNERVIDSLQFYKEYLRQGKYHLEDVYKQAPFEVNIDVNQPQVIGKPLQIKIIDDSTFELVYDFQNSGSTAQIYSTKEKVQISTPVGLFSQVFKFGDKISLPFFNGIVKLKVNSNYSNNTDYFIRFLNFDSVVNKYKSTVKIETSSRDASSVLRLSLIGLNKSKIVDFLNATTDILKKTELERKNLYATNTIKFIDSSLSTVGVQLKDVTDEMDNFIKTNKIYDVKTEINQYAEQLKSYDQEKLSEQSKLNYLNNLEDYLRTKTDYTKIAAPTTVGIDEVNILSGVRNIITLSTERRNLEYSTKEGSIIFNEIDRRIDAEKSVLLEAIAITKRTINQQLNIVIGEISKL